MALTRYQDGPEVRVGDQIIHHATARAVVVAVVPAAEWADHGADGPCFLIRCEQCGATPILVEVDSADWEDVALVGRGA